MDKLEILLATFMTLSSANSGEVPHSVHLDFKKHPQHIVVNCAIHGDEVGCIPGMIEVIRQLKSGEIKYGGRVSFLLGNPEAIRKNSRYVERDMNRAFKLDEKDLSVDGKRAKEIAPLIRSSNYFIDIHQTIGPSLRPFYIFEFHEQAYWLARALGVADTLVTHSAKAEFVEGTMTAGEFARRGNSVSVTVELGEKGLTDLASDKTQELLTNLFRLVDLEVAESFSIEQEALKKPDLKSMEIKHRVEFKDPKMSLNEGFKNLEYITKSKVLGKQGEGFIQSPAAGFILFPKYPSRDEQGIAQGSLPSYLYMLAEPIEEGAFNRFTNNKVKN